MYAAQLPRYTQLFPRRNILVLQFDDLMMRERTADYVGRILSFFGLPARPELSKLPEDNQWDYARKVKLPLCSTREKLLEVFSGWNEALSAVAVCKCLGLED